MLGSTARRQTTLLSLVAAAVLAAPMAGCDEQDVRNAAKDAKAAGEKAVKDPEGTAKDIEKGLNSAKRKVEQAGRDARRKFDRGD